MRCWIARAYGNPEVLALTTRPTPPPKAGQILVQVRAASVSSGDARIRGWAMPRGFGMVGRLIFGLTRPRQGVLGSDFAGIVAAIGPGVTKFRPGDAIFGSTELKLGCHADHLIIPANGAIAALPAGLNFTQASALIFGGVTALQYLRRAGLQAGDAILVCGAGGAVGNALVQLAAHAGARVTAVASSNKAALLRSLGATDIIDYRTQDPLQGRERYDIVADTVGSYPFAACLPILRPGGRHLAVIGDLAALLARPRDGKRSIGGGASAKAEDIAALAKLAETGALRPVIDSIFPFEQLPAAYRQVETGHKQGSVVLSID